MGSPGFSMWLRKDAPAAEASEAPRHESAYPVLVARMSMGGTGPRQGQARGGDLGDSGSAGRGAGASTPGRAGPGDAGSGEGGPGGPRAPETAAIGPEE